MAKLARATPRTIRYYEEIGLLPALRSEWESGVPDPTRRRQILDEALEHIDHQLAQARRRRDEIATLEAELLAKRKRLLERRRETEGRRPLQKHSSAAPAARFWRGLRPSPIPTPRSACSAS